MKKILVLNVGESNKGNRALMISLLALLKEVIPEASITLMGPSKIDRPGLKVFRQLFLPPVSFKYLCRLIFLLSQCALKRLCSRLHLPVRIRLNPTLEIYEQNDMILNSGGDQLSGPSFNMTSFMNILPGILLGKKVVLYGESLGYFTNPIANFIACQIFNCSNLILVRENLSRQYLLKSKVSKPKISIIPDPAFLLNAIDELDVATILSKEGISQLKSPIIGVNTSGLIKNRESSGYYGKNFDYIKIMTETIVFLVEQYRATVLLIPHVYTDKYDDRIPNKMIMDNLKSHVNLQVKEIRGEYDPQTLKGIIGKCDLFIGARMHATIGALSMNIPTVGIAYSHKMHGILGEMLDLGDYVIDVQTLKYIDLKGKIEQAWNNRDSISKKLRESIHEIKKDALLGTSQVKELLG